MTVVVPVDLSQGRPSVIVADAMRDALQTGSLNAVNAGALVIVTDARQRVKAAVGFDQRLSGVRYRYDIGGTTTTIGSRRRTTAETRGKGGTRVNPYYREANSPTKPTALIGVRGPIHYVEHPRKGGYKVPALFTDKWAGPPGRRTVRRGTRIATPQGPRMSVKVGAITTPLAPVGKAFIAAPRTMQKAALTEIEESFRKSAATASRGL